MAEQEPPLHACVDTPRGTVLGERYTLLRGWCFATGGRRVAKLQASNSRDSQAARLGFERLDVAQAHKLPAASDSGFCVALRLPAGRSLTRLVATLDDGSRHTVAELSLETPKTGVFEEWIRLARFWSLAWAGLPSGWDLLTQNERDFLLARADQRGWLNIGRHAQHPPRPLSSESFPRPRLSPDILPRIDLVTPSYNQGAYLADTVCSVLKQTGVKLRLHVQDGDSNDKSTAILARLSKEFPDTAERQFSWQSRRDGGQAHAINLGFERLRKAAPEDVMGYLNSDDLILPGALRFVAEYFAMHPKVDVLYGHRIIMDSEGRETGRWLSPRRRCDDLRMIDLIPQECLFWRRRLWDQVGGINPFFRFALDWDLLQRFQTEGACFARVPRFLGAFRMHPQQKTQAWMESDGTPEMELLRTRAFGRPVTEAEFRRSMSLGQFDSALVYALFKRGWRV